MLSRQDLVSALDNVSYDKNVVLEMMDKHPDMVKILSETKDKVGKPLFDALAIDDILFNCKDTIEHHPDRITAVLNNPEEINMISSWKNKGAGLWRAVGDPLNSTIERNPEAFGIKVEPKQENKESISNSLKEQSKTSEEQNITNRIATARKRLAGKIDEKLGTNLSDIKLPKKIKDIEAKISKHFDKSGR